MSTIEYLQLALQLSISLTALSSFLMREGVAGTIGTGAGGARAVA
jgi:hypothetical protein